MSRSRRKTPICGWASSGGQKIFQKYEHRRFRRAVKIALLVGKEEMPHHKQFGNEWASPRDGKMYFGYMKYALPRTFYLAGICHLYMTPEEEAEDYNRLMRK